MTFFASRFSCFHAFTAIVWCGVVLAVASPAPALGALPGFISLDRTVKQYQNPLGGPPGEQIVVADNGGIAYYGWDHLSQRLTLLGGANDGDQRDNGEDAEKQRFHDRFLGR